jgi:hypothetical protein
MGRADKGRWEVWWWWWEWEHKLEEMIMNSLSSDSKVRWREGERRDKFTTLT